MGWESHSVGNTIRHDKVSRLSEARANREDTERAWKRHVSRRGKARGEANAKRSGPRQADPPLSTFGRKRLVSRARHIEEPTTH